MNGYKRPGFPAWFIAIFVVAVIGIFAWYAFLGVMFAKYGMPALDSAVQILENTAQNTKPVQ